MGRHVQEAIAKIEEALERARLRDSHRERAYRRAIMLLLIERRLASAPVSDDAGASEHEEWLREKIDRLAAYSIFDDDVLAGIPRDEVWGDISAAFNAIEAEIADGEAVASR